MQNLEDATLTNRSKLASPVTRHVDIIYLLIWCTEKGITSFLWYSCQKHICSIQSQSTRHTNPGIFYAITGQYGSWKKKLPRPEGTMQMWRLNATCDPGSVQKPLPGRLMTWMCRYFANIVVLCSFSGLVIVWCAHKLLMLGELAEEYVGTYCSV